MKLGIMVNEGPYQHQASDSAYCFTKAALEMGHAVSRVFFYHDGVNNGTRLTTPPSDDRNLQRNWTELADKYDIDLVICVAAAQEVVLVGAAFDQDVSLVFMDDGVFQLKKGQDTTGIGMKNFSPAFRALEHYDVDKLYVERESIEARGLGEQDLIVSVQIVTAEQLGELIDEQDVLLNF
jgi:tRNA 2-thiouridine synthesizing protein C